MVAAGADVESCDWNGLISWTFGYNSEDFIKDLLILLAQSGNKVNAKTLICCMQDIHDHRGGAGTPVSVPEFLQLYQKGKLYQESIMEKCRLVIRRKNDCAYTGTEFISGNSTASDTGETEKIPCVWLP